MPHETEGSTTRLLIVDDHELARYGLAFVFNNLASRFEIAGEAENGQQAIEISMATKPDIILMDIGMPVLDGIEATKAIKAALPETRIVIFTSHHENDAVLAALSSGADAYCMKSIRTERLIQVVEMVMEGSIWLDPQVARPIMQHLLSHASKNTVNKEKTTRKKYNTSLTQREKEVLGLIVEGKSNKLIASEIGITIHTVKAHVATIIQKLAVDDRTQAAIKALKEELLSQNRSV